MINMYHGFVSFSQLSESIRWGLHQVPRDIDLVVGIPRSGMVPAYMIALALNRLVIDLPTFLVDGSPKHGHTREPAVKIGSSMSAKRILLVDDSYHSGDSMRKAVADIKAAGFSGNIVTCSAIVTPDVQNDVDVYFISMPWPRMYEWNFLHTYHTQFLCSDFDGVLCVDPNQGQDDDGETYRKFIMTAAPLYLPTSAIGHIVSARLEKYRDLTEHWLKKHGIEYKQLHLVDLPTKDARNAQRAHIRLKSKIYRETEAPLFVESSDAQAAEIAQITGKPVLSIERMRVHDGTGIYLDNLAPLTQKAFAEARKRTKAYLKQTLPVWAIDTVKSVRRVWR